jgi:hypothetical protein
MPKTPSARAGGNGSGGRGIVGGGPDGFLITRRDLRGGNCQYTSAQTRETINLRAVPMLPLLNKLFSSIACSLTLPLLLREMMLCRCTAAFTFLILDFICAKGEVAAVKLLRLLRSLGRSPAFGLSKEPTALGVVSSSMSVISLDGVREMIMGESGQPSPGEEGGEW